MKHLKFISLCLFFIAISSCEKDDICSESKATTPNMVIDLLDVVDRETPKSVTRIRVKGINPDNEVIAEYNGTNVTQIIVPLVNNVPDEETITQYQIYKDFEIDDNGTPDDSSDDFETGNPDIITISYVIKEVYVSAACGFKAKYENVSITVEDENTTGLWILDQEPTLDNLTISDDTTTHYNLFH